MYRLNNNNWCLSIGFTVFNMALFLNVGTDGSQTGDLKVGAKSECIQIHWHRIGKKKKKTIHPYTSRFYTATPPDQSYTPNYIAPLSTGRPQKHTGDVCIPQNWKSTMLRIHVFHLQRIKHVKISLIRDNADCLLSG